MVTSIPWHNWLYLDMRRSGKSKVETVSLLLSARLTSNIDVILNKQLSLKLFYFTRDGGFKSHEEGFKKNIDAFFNA